MVKEQIMLAAFDLFSQYGIKNVSMDDIAKSMCISKRTIYEFFEDKEALLIEAMALNSNKLLNKLEQLEEGPYTALEVILLFYEEFMKRPRWFNQKYYDDLKRFPKALQKTDDQKVEFLKKCMLLFNRGVKDGTFKADVNFEIVALLAKEQTKMIRPSQAFSNHSMADVFKTILFTFLRGISTEKGMVILERHTLKQTYIQ